MTIHIDHQVHAHHPDSLPDEYAAVHTNTYTDLLGRDWPYWPVSAVDQMWTEVTCNQFDCNRPAAFVGLADVLGDGTLFFDSAAAWCYWCMPHDAMSSAAVRMARHAEWARRETVHDCVAVIKQVWAEASDTDTIENVMDNIISEMHRLREGWEAKLTYSILPEEYAMGRKHTPEQDYAVRPVGTSNAVPEDATALALSCGKNR